ncbi:hypothetical protein BDV28DRAFT_58232 [Aspergillus coremiiformis]|uniref:Phosphoribosylaminoimidazole-succinocarboxamide synthase n=1 Tax=Aspergillus coremiiformis TaxID=138285 RepID=A0A5N6ZCF9_9EURO|nr:hypothetical protein BDV28DRAFT_58232 [Aspergillus coremiiformis]
MLASGSGNVSLRTVSSSRPQVLHSGDQQSVAASDDYYSFSSNSRSPSDGSHATVVRYATPNSHPVSQTSSPAVSRTHLAPPIVGSTSRIEQPVKMPSDNRNAPSPLSSTVRAVQDRETHMIPMTESTSRQVPRDSYAGPPPTPGMDDVPYLRFAINQLTRDEESRRVRRPSSAASEDYPVDRLIWDEGLGYFVRSPESSRIPPVEQPLLQHPSPGPVDRSPQESVELEAFVAVNTPKDGLLYPRLDFVPGVLRPWALLAVIFCTLLMIAGIVFCNVWSQKYQGVWDYDGLVSARYFVVQFLPQVLAVIITLWTFVIQAAIYRTMPFAILASERKLGHVLQRLPSLSRNFLVPDFSHFQHGEPLVGLSLVSIWLSNLITLPLLSSFFQAKWFMIDGRGTWRWTAVQDVGWALVAVYGLLTLALVALVFRFVRTWSGLMWDPVSLADLISIIQRSNILPDFEQSEILPDVGDSLNARTLRLGYWQLSNREATFYGIGEVAAPLGNPSLHLSEKSREKQPYGLTRVSYDVEQQVGEGKYGFDEHIYAPSVRYRWTPWFLRDTFIVAWTVTIGALFIAFVLVSFIHDAIQGGFPPRLPTLPSAKSFSSSNFLYSFIPALIGNVLFLAWQPIDVYFRALQPFASLSSPEGAPAEKSLLLSYPSCFPFHVTALAILHKHYKVAWISFMGVASAGIPILAGGVFIALNYPSEAEIRIAAQMPAFYATVAFCALYTVSFLCIWPRRCRYLPHDISTLADQISFLYQSPLLSDKILREPRSKADLVTRLVMPPPGDRDHPLYGFGIYVGRDGKEHLGIDRLHRPGRADMLITTGSMK